MGGETGAQMITAAMRQVVLYGLPALSFLFMVWMPAALQLTFTTGTTIGVIQSLLFKSNTARRWLGITPLVKPEATTKIDTAATAERQRMTYAPTYQPPTAKPVENAVAEPKTIIERTSEKLNGGVKTVMESTGFGGVMDKSNEQRATKEEKSRAQAFESRRVREIQSEKRADRSRRR